MTEHLKGHASLAEMISTHVSSFRALISRAHMDKGMDRAYVDHELAALKAIETACVIEQATRDATEELPVQEIATLAHYAEGSKSAEILRSARTVINFLAKSSATPADHSAAYAGAREDLAIWKKRALEAEELNRKFMREINGPTFMGEPANHIGDAAEKVDAGSVPVVMMSYEEVAQKHSDRYRVENNDSMFAQWKVICGTGTRKIFTGTKIQCLEAAAELTTAFLDGVYVAAQAPQPDAQSVRDEVIEECAGVCDRLADDNREDYEFEKDTSFLLYAKKFEIAARNIRAVKNIHNTYLEFPNGSPT